MLRDLTEFEKDELLRWFMHWLPLDRRRELMTKYPHSYNKLIGREIMKTVQVGDTLGPGVQCSVGGKTYREGETLPDRELKP